MNLSTLNGRLGRLLRWGRAPLRLPLRLAGAFPEFPEEVRRPVIFTLYFWGALVASYVIWAFDLLGTDTDNGLFGVGQGVDLIPGTLMTGALIAVWSILPWDPRSSRWRKVAAPTFLVTVFAVGQLFGGIYWSLAFYPLAFANGVFLFGFRRGLYYAAAILGMIFTHTLLSIRLDYPDFAAELGGWSVGNALGMSAFFVPVAALVIGFCVPIVEANRRREEVQALLKELEGAHANLKDYASRVRELTISEERARMAREMHDSVGHYLTVVNVQLEAANKFLDADSPDDADKAHDEVKKAKRLASEALSEVRRSVRALKPLVMEEGESVSGALGELVRDFDGNGPSVSFSVSGEERALPAEVEIALYRTLQESLTNVLKHSKARAIRASLVFDPDSVRLTVTDNGEGAPPDSDRSGFGLQALAERASDLGGTFESGDATGGGFAVKVSLPVGDA